MAKEQRTDTSNTNEPGARRPAEYPDPIACRAVAWSRQLAADGMEIGRAMRVAAGYFQIPVQRLYLQIGVATVYKERWARIRPKPVTELSLQDLVKQLRRIDKAIKAMERERRKRSEERRAMERTKQEQQGDEGVVR